MLPAPTTIAAPPRPTRKVSWNPAVPPPPVSGAAVGKVLADGLGAGECEWVGVGVGVGDGEWLGVGVALAEGLVLGVGVLVAVSVTVGEAVGVAELVPVGDPPGDSDGGVAEGVPLVQAAADADASTVTVAQPMALNLAPSGFPAIVGRIFREPPLRQAGRSQESAAGHKGKACRRYAEAMARSSLGY
jgi:hypothetical protein